MSHPWRARRSLTVALAILAVLAVAVPLLAMRSGSPAGETAVSPVAPRSAAPADRRPSAEPVPRLRPFTGYAFDACHAPSQRQMDAWRAHSPYRGVGVYIAGANRYCRHQPHLDAGWVGAQLRNGWHLLPLTVGRQAACTRVAHWHKISARPAGGYAAARRQGRAEADGTLRAARGLGLPAGTTMWLDMEAFDISSVRCRTSTLAFVSAWTDRLHAAGYRSGFYSGGSSGIRALEEARLFEPGAWALPDQVWVADWNGRDGDLSGRVSADGWQPASLVHQYTGSHAETYGGVRLEVDSNFARLGGGPVPTSGGDPCRLPHDFGRYRALRPGAQGAQVAALQCFLRERGVSEVPVTGRYDARTAAAVRRFQLRRRLPARGLVERRTWTALLAQGSSPRLRYGAGSDAVRRVQRALNADGHEDLAVDGDFGGATLAAVKRYQRRHGAKRTGVVTARMWHQLQAGRG